MKRSKTIRVILIIFTFIVFFSGCANNDMEKTTIEEETVFEKDSSCLDALEVESAPETQSESGIGDVGELKLDQTYTTQFGAINEITYPSFSFKYPNKWEITKEEVMATSEWVTLSNDRGVTVDFINNHEKNINGGSATIYTLIEVSKIADSSFVPGYVQATNYSNLGDFMVAELKTTGKMNSVTDLDFIPVEDGAVSYAVLPESMAGEQIVNSAYYMDLAFWYSGNIMFVAFAPDGQFTPQEKTEVIAILSSFKTE